MILRIFHVARELQVRFLGAPADFVAVARPFRQCGTVDAVTESQNLCRSLAPAHSTRARWSRVTLFVEFREPSEGYGLWRAPEQRVLWVLKREGNVELEVVAKSGSDFCSIVFDMQCQWLSPEARRTQEQQSRASIVTVGELVGTGQRSR